MSVIIDTKKMSVDDIRTMLINEYGYSEEKAAELKGKSAVVEALQIEMEETLSEENVEISSTDERTMGHKPTSQNGEENVIQRASGEPYEDFIKRVGAWKKLVEEEDEQDEQDEQLEQTPPIPSDPEWTSFVIGHLTKQELVNDYPRVDGLRRISNIFLGECTYFSTRVVQAPDPVNEHRATVVCHMGFSGSEYFREKTISGASDVYSGNVDAEFKKHPVATAESRAEARALRRALQIQTVSAEEMPTNIKEDDPGDVGDNTKGKITNTQLDFYGVMGKRLDIDIKTFINQELGDIVLIDITHEQSLELQKKLSEYQQDIDNIPKTLGSFIPNWRE